MPTSRLVCYLACYQALYIFSMMYLRIFTLDIDTVNVISTLALIVSLAGFIIMYNKSVKNTIDRKDLDKQKEDLSSDYMDKFRAVHHRMDGIERINESDHIKIRDEMDRRYESIDAKLDLILGNLLKK